jgi:hypothetical protein
MTLVLALKLMLLGGCLSLLTGGILGCKSHGKRTITLKLLGGGIEWVDDTELDEKGTSTWESDVIEGSPVTHKLFGPPAPKTGGDD